MGIEVNPSKSFEIIVGPIRGATGQEPKASLILGRIVAVRWNEGYNYFGKSVNFGY
jgi:hypothetical protein